MYSVQCGAYKVLVIINVEDYYATQIQRICVIGK